MHYNFGQIYRYLPLKDIMDRPLGYSLSIRNAVPISQLPNPRRATFQARKILKEEFMQKVAVSKPFMMIHGSSEDQKLATIPSEITISAIDGWGADSTVSIRYDNCL